MRVRQFLKRVMRTMIGGSRRRVDRPLTVGEAQRRRVCRFCKSDAKPGPGNPLVLDYGGEYAHEQCRKRHTGNQSPPRLARSQNVRTGDEPACIDGGIVHSVNPPKDPSSAASRAAIVRLFRGGIGIRCWTRHGTGLRWMRCKPGLFGVIVKDGGLHIGCWWQIRFEMLALHAAQFEPHAPKLGDPAQRPADEK